MEDIFRANYPNIKLELEYHSTKLADFISKAITKMANEYKSKDKPHWSWLVTRINDTFTVGGIYDGNVTEVIEWFNEKTDIYLEYSKVDRYGK